MEIKLNTPLKIEEIDFRIQSINRGGYATILAYKDARVDMNRLDAVYGVEGWQNTYEVVSGNLFCSISIWSESKKQWVSKQNVGTESAAEKEKGQASDAFKRAGFCLGIGRELYDYPIISVKLNDNKEKPKHGEWFMDNDRPKQGFALKLKEWVWSSQFTEGKLTFLLAKDQTGKVRFTFGKEIKETIKPEDLERITKAVSELKDVAGYEILKEKEIPLIKQYPALKKLFSAKLIKLT